MDKIIIEYEDYDEEYIRISDLITMLSNIHNIIFDSYGNKYLTSKTFCYFLEKLILELKGYSFKDLKDNITFH